MNIRSQLTQLASAACLSLAAMPAAAALYTPSIGALLPGYVQNDDGIFAAVNLGFSLNFFGTNYSSLFINNNGNATFGAPTRAFNPAPLNIQSTQPMIAPYWTDLDSTNGGPSAGIYLAQTAHQLIVTWQDLGYFNQNYTGRVTFQLVLNDPSAPIAAGESVIGFFYGRMTSGNDTHTISAGFGDGLSAVNEGEIAYDSGTSGAASAALDNTSVWFDLIGGAPTPTVPEPASAVLALAGLALIWGQGRYRRR